jgi:chlorobactene glucosyltransferase
MFIFETLLVAVWLVALVTTLLNIAFIPRLRPVDWTTQPRDGSDGVKAAAPLPTVSIVVPARNEERTIDRTVRGLLAQTYLPLEVIVVDDGSTDGTAGILAALAAENPKLIVVTGEEPPPGWLGKPWALHEGSRRARGELLLFVDADIQYMPAAVATVVARLEKRDVAMLSLLPRFEMHGFWENVGLTQLAMAAFTIIPVWLGNFTTFVGLGIGGGPGNLVRRSAFEEMGGYETLKNAVVDDVGMARQIRAHGRRTDVILGDRLASLRMYHGAQEVIDGFTKNLFPALGGSYVAAAVMFVLMVAFHFVPYVLAARGDLLAIAAVVLITITRVVLFARLDYRLDVAVVGHPFMTLLWIWILARSVWMTGIRRRLHWRGRVYEKTWTRFGSKRR